MDFLRILEEWERGQSSTRGQSSPPDKDAANQPPNRNEMERARVEAELDLHGLGQTQAIEALRQFLGRCAAQGLHKVRIIHGKGLHSVNSRGVLADVVKRVLSKNPNVAAWGAAGKQDGGGGASWAWLSARGK